MAEVENSLRRTWSLNLGFGSNAATEIAFEIRSASETARKAALEEAARWHEEQAVVAHREARHLNRDGHPWADCFVRAVTHKEAAANFRALTARSEAQEKQR